MRKLLFAMSSPLTFSGREVRIDSCAALSCFGDSILVSSSVHSYTFLKMEGSHQWIKHDDLAPSNLNYTLEQSNG